MKKKENVLATKEDIIRIQKDLENKMDDVLKWMMATMIGTGGLIVALIKLIK